MEQADKLHKCLLLIADEIKRICDKNSIKYFLIGGSLLGAVRHKGFIPWDDDLDIGMMRTDYQRFVEVCKSDLGDQFILCTLQTEKNYAYGFAKIRLKGTALIETSTPQNTEIGIFVDVFPIDKMPKSKVSQKVQFLSSKIFARALFKKYEYKVDESRHNYFVRFLYGIMSYLPKSFLIKMIERCNTRYNKAKSFECYINLHSSYKYGKEIFPINSLDSGFVGKQFEGRIYTIPKNAETILTSLYGDFMKLPPKEKQVFRHSLGEIKFGPYDNISVD